MSITSREEAKALYFKYNCNGYHLFREEGFVFEEYKKRYLTKNDLYEWQQEWFQLRYKELLEKKTPYLFSVLADNMVISKENIKSLNSIINSLIFTGEKDRRVVIHLLLGTQDYSLRSGLIFNAYDLGEKEVALSFSRFCKELLTGKTDNHEMEELYAKEWIRFQKTMTDLSIMN